MCGIFGYTGQKEAQAIVLQGLKQLEYRGYDSSGMAVQNGSRAVKVEKTQGKIRNLEEMLTQHPLHGKTAIGHTRWATHGVPSKENAHPHLDGAGRIAVVHNGIIENFSSLREGLQAQGVRFRSETDTEVIVHLLAKYYRGDLEKAVVRALKELKGSYAFAAVSSQEPGRIVAAKKDSPLVVGVSRGESFLASDVSAFLDHTKDAIFLENDQVVSLEPGAVRVLGAGGKPVKAAVTHISWNASQAKKNGFPHFMLKEIFDQPDVVSAIFKERVRKGRIHFDELEITVSQLKKIKRIAIIACGTAYHAGLVAKYVLEEFTDFPVWVDTSSEFRYRNPKVDSRTLVIAISQSGETADTLAGLREARKKGALTLSVCNVLGSSLAREARGVIYTHAGPEIAVASTKAYTAQLAVLTLFAFYLSQIFGTLPRPRSRSLLKEFLRVPSLMRMFLEEYRKDEKEWAEKAHDFNVRYHDQLDKYYSLDPEKRKRAPNCFFLYLARNINTPNALEGALKLKEISYISAEGYAAGEMKHGPIALIDENPWVVCIAPRSRTYDKMLSNMQEIRARGGILVPIITQGDSEVRKLDPLYVIHIPKIEEIFSPFLTVLPLQLIAYSVAREFGEDIDQPRNLAKSVTVE